ncbi:hypothetical protein predicted by Glimmer/Critica [Sorangium cellulosum So ce56]|uniref:Uncharacterized protein n=1 Tax=Sorangium cellulosum (strain So ce56) TaxID=448385 RepID=A9G874_SORC5|nr:hypothetical protein [Sorangium cellulosum]CAN95956.1 hypothetical protein predicted by Glimmer/Critica [Sorangium cellulosum So ce56]
MIKQVIATALAVVAGCAAPTPAPDARPAESARPSSVGAAPTAAAATPGASAAEVASAPRPEDASAPEPPQDGGDRAAAEAPAADAPPGPGAEPTASADASAATSARADNKILPALESEELTARARALFDAIVKKEPALAEPFWFPKEPFIPLKDVKDPGKYWDNLHAAYVNDVKSMHRKRKSWEGARFVGFVVGSRPKWVPPGDEVNKIGYYRSFHGKLKYEIDGKPASLDVHTIISWQGRWYITHLGDFKKR